MYGRFTDGVGTFEGTDHIDGHDVEVRFVWSDITESSARWSQTFRVAGHDWDENWVMTFGRPTGGS